MRQDPSGAVQDRTACPTTRATWSGAALPVVSQIETSIQGSSATARSTQSSASRSGTTPSKGQWKQQDRLKRTLIPAATASPTMADRSAKLSARDRLRFDWLWLSVTDMNRPTRCVPAALASS